MFPTSRLGWWAGRFRGFIEGLKWKSQVMICLELTALLKLPKPHPVGVLGH